MIVLDASVLIAHLAGDDAYADRALDILDTEEELAIHPITLAECLVGPVRVRREAEAVRAIERLGIEQLPFGPQQPLALAKLQATTSLRLPDCCVLAAAMHTGAILATFDDTLARGARERGVRVAPSPPGNRWFRNPLRSAGPLRTLAPVMVIIRFRVDDVVGFQGRVDAALAVLHNREGFEAADLQRNLDEPDLWALVIRWRNVGSYRRALQGYESKTVVVPLLSEALDEPSAYEDPDLLDEPAVTGLW